ncbi:MAG: (d)CMP kinase [Cryomorphaceae bacterium]|nr:MAG: (d)CMP kinase [Cryomorphaceae bacterium]
MLNFIVTIDGPSSSGKSTLAKRLAKKLSILHIDSGSIYRAVTLYALQNNLLLNGKFLMKKLINILSMSSISLKENSNGIFKMHINNLDVENKIRGSKVSKHVSEIAKHKKIRDFVLKIQRDISKNKSIVMDGRDIGSFVFPDADVKFYIDSSIKTRSIRRFNQLKQFEKKLSIDEVKYDLLSRDKIDKNRKNSPLIIPENSLFINNDNRSIDDVLNIMLDHVKSIINKKVS